MVVGITFVLLLLLQILQVVVENTFYMSMVLQKLQVNLVVQLTQVIQALYINKYLILEAVILKGRLMKLLYLTKYFQLLKLQLYITQVLQ